MNATEVIALGQRVEEAREAHRIAGENRRAALEALRAAENVSDAAWTDYQVAMNALIVAVGGDDRSFVLGLPSSLEPLATVAEK